MPPIPGEAAGSICNIMAGYERCCRVCCACRVDVCRCPSVGFCSVRACECRRWIPQYSKNAGRQIDVDLLALSQSEPGVKVGRAQPTRTVQSATLGTPSTLLILLLPVSRGPSGIISVPLGPSTKADLLYLIRVVEQNCSSQPGVNECVTARGCLFNSANLQPRKLEIILKLKWTFIT